MTRFFGCGSRLEWLGILNVLVPTHSPNPSLAPPGERGGLHVAASLKAGTLRSNARWPQSEGKTATGRCSQIRRRISSPALDFSGNSLPAVQSGQALPQRQLASSGLQQIENPPIQFDGNAPKRTFFPPSKTRPHVAVSSPFRPGGGGEGSGERGGIQRIKNRNAAHNNVIRSIGIDHEGQEISQTSERNIHSPPRVAAKGVQ